MSEDLVLRYKDNNSQRTPCVLVLDGSQSMDGQPIDELNRGLKVLESELKEDVLARGRVRVLVVRVGGAPSVIGDWTDAVDFSVPTIEAYGNTPLGEGMELALKLHFPEAPMRVEDNGGVVWHGNPGPGNKPSSSFVVYCDVPVEETMQAAIARCIEQYKPVHSTYRLRVKAAKRKVES